jgi:nuclear transport factor 2 (NTF2) superfamily protein
MNMDRKSRLGSDPLEWIRDTRKEAEERNVKNLLVFRDKSLALKYIKNWQDHAEHSEPYAGRRR